MLSLHSGKCVVSFGVRPAPETPLLESTMMSSGSISPALSSGASGQDGRRRIAARVGHQLRLANLLAKQFRQAVDGLAQPGRVGVLLAVPLGVDVGIVQAGSRR